MMRSESADLPTSGVDAWGARKGIALAVVTLAAWIESGVPPARAADLPAAPTSAAASPDASPSDPEPTKEEQALLEAVVELRTQLLDDLERLRQKEGRGPTLEEVRAAFVRRGGGAAPNDPSRFIVLQAVFEAAAKLQKPAISADDLIQLALARRDAIRSIRMHWTAVFDGSGLSPQWPNHMGQTGEILIKGRKVRFKEELGPEVGSPVDVQTLSFDGEDERSRTLGKGHSNGMNMISQFLGLDEYFSQGNPFYEMLLIDSDQSYQSPTPAHDLIKLLGSCTFIQEKPEQVDGRECLLVCDMFRTLYLAPDLGFAPVRYVDRSFFALVEGRYAPEAVTLDYSDFRDCGEGIWIPFKVVLDLVEGGKTARKVAIDIRECRVNEDVDDSEFVEIFPRGQSVQDNIRHVHFRAGTVPSITGTLEGALPKPPPLRLWKLIVVDLVALAVMIGSIFVARRRRHRAS